MKRVGNLFERVVSFENLLEAVRKALQGSGRTEASCKFFFHLEPELLKLRKELKESSYQPGPYRYFRVRDPKERTIAVAPFRDRVAHHAVVRVLTPVYERVFIHDSYATRPEKGTHRAILRAQACMRRSPWFLKTDIQKYFDSVDHDILMEILGRKLKDERLLHLVDRIVRNPSTLGKGLPIGNLTSQFLANVYLDPLDHFIQEHLGIQGYVRYMDDLVVFGSSRGRLEIVRTRIAGFLDEWLGLKLKDKGTYVNRSCHGLSFLGMRVYPGMIRVRPRNRVLSLRKLRRRVEEWRSGACSEETMATSLESIVGHLRFFQPGMRIV